MEQAAPHLRKIWLILGGIGFGVYFTLGLGYFDTMGFGTDTLVRYVPILLLLMGQCIVSAILLYGKGTPPSPLKLGLIPLLTFSLTGLLLFGYGAWMTGSGVTLELFVRIFRDLLLVGLLPVVAALVLMQGKPKAKETSPQVTERAPKLEQTVQDSESIPLTFQPSGAGSSIDLSFSNLIMVEAADNYCKIHFLEAGESRMEMLRIKMKEIETVLAEKSQQEPQPLPVFRCHRSFLVNGNKVEKITGNSQSYKLKMTVYEELVPVSRSFDLTPIRQLLDSPKNGG